MRTDAGDNCFDNFFVGEQERGSEDTHTTHTHARAHWHATHAHTHTHTHTHTLHEHAHTHTHIPHCSCVHVTQAEFSKPHVSER